MPAHAMKTREAADTGWPMRNRDAEAVAAAGYPRVREAFNRVLNDCAGKLRQADWALARDILELDSLEDLEEGAAHFLTDTALFSRPGDPFARAGRKRPVDRIAPRLPARRDPLRSAIAARLPRAFFSIFETQGPHPDGGVTVKDLVDEGRPLRVMDNGLAASAEPGAMFAARFVDLGPWHVGFGIVLMLRKSEAAAILIAVSHGGELADKRGSLHELVYLCRLHHGDLVVAALAPMISALSLAIDASDVELEQIVSGFASAMVLAESRRKSAQCHELAVTMRASATRSVADL